VCKVKLSRRRHRTRQNETECSDILHSLPLNSNACAYTAVTKHQVFRTICSLYTYRLTNLKLCWTIFYIFYTSIIVVLKHNVDVSPENYLTEIHVIFLTLFRFIYNVNKFSNYYKT
jgi:hypothetical protein